MRSTVAQHGDRSVPRVRGHRHEAFAPAHEGTKRAVCDDGRMSVVKINAITVPEGMGPELEARFAVRAGTVENQPGFEEFMLLRPTAGDHRYFVVTRWESEEAFQNWRNGQAFQHAHGQTPDGGGHPGGHPGGGAGGEAPKPPVGISGDLLEFDVVSLATPS